MSTSTDNPLLEMAELPAFDRIEARHVEPALQHVLEDNRQRLQRMLADVDEPTWQNLMEPLALMQNRLSRCWSPVSHLYGVIDSSELREAHDRCLPLLTDYFTDLGQNRQLYDLLGRLQQAGGNLDEIQHKILNDRLRSFELSGVGLPPLQQAQFKAIQSELATLSSQFQQNVRTTTDAFHKHFESVEALAGLPESALEMAAHAAQAAGMSGWLLTLQAPSYIATMTYADDRDLRHSFYLAYQTRAATTGPHDPDCDNAPLLARMLELRNETASLLGYGSYAEMSLVTKMAEGPADVLSFLRDLAAVAVPAARQEFSALSAFARQRDGLEELKPWDVAYYSEKLREHQYDLAQETLKPWFPAERVLNGLFEIVGRLYGITVRARSGVPVWDTDVRYFELIGDDGNVRGAFYLDMYARKGKRGGAWMDDCINRLRIANDAQLPVAHLVCNLTPPAAGKPAMFTHDEVVTLFHEFGHGLHHMLTRVDFPDVAGINGVEWDAVELPSQFMEKWCWQAESLQLITGHYQSGEPLPQPIVDKLRAARNFQAAMQTVRQLEFALFDMLIHQSAPAPDADQVHAILQQVRDEVAVIKPPAQARFENAFTHIFGGGYAAGYYSYKWAEVLAADAFESFIEGGIFSRELGQRFASAILERGATRKAADLFVEFKGRAPDVGALLRDAGLVAA